MHYERVNHYSILIDTADKLSVHSPTGSAIRPLEISAARIVSFAELSTTSTPPNPVFPSLVRLNSASWTEPFDFVCTLYVSVTNSVVCMSELFDLKGTTRYSGMHFQFI